MSAEQDAYDAAYEAFCTAARNERYAQRDHHAGIISDTKYLETRETLRIADRIFDLAEQALTLAEKTLSKEAIS